MAIPVPPDAHVRAKSFEVDDEPSFASADQVTYNAANGRWTFRTQQMHDMQLDQVATAVERLLLQDFAASLEIGSFDIDPVLDSVDPMIVICPGFTIALSQVSDAPGAYAVGSAASVSVGAAWSLRTLIRDHLGIGIPYVP